MDKNIRQVKQWIIFFMIVLFLSGLTAIPLESELVFSFPVFFAPNSIGCMD